MSRNSTFPPNSIYFRIEISGGDAASSPQLSQLAFVHNDLNAPVANVRDLTTNAGSATAIRLTATDADGDPLTFRISEQPLHGTLTSNVDSTK